MGSEKRTNHVRGDTACELGPQEASRKEVRQLKEQDVVELDKLAGEAFEVRMNGKLFGYGEIVVVTDLMAVRLTELAEPPQEAGS